MGVYIPDIDIPAPGEVFYFVQDRETGKVLIQVGSTDKELKVVHVPPHGRLIDADALKKIVASSEHMDAGIFDGKTLYSDHLCVGADYEDVCKAIDETPTVIEAEEGE